LEKLIAGEVITEEGVRPVARENIVEGELPASEDDLERLEWRVSTWMYGGSLEFGRFSQIGIGTWSGLSSDLG
jgi:hypothetical protein